MSEVIVLRTFDEENCNEHEKMIAKEFEKCTPMGDTPSLRVYYGYDIERIDLVVGKNNNHISWKNIIDCQVGSNSLFILSFDMDDVTSYPFEDIKEVRVLMESKAKTELKEWLYEREVAFIKEKPPINREELLDENYWYKYTEDIMINERMTGFEFVNYNKRHSSEFKSKNWIKQDLYRREVQRRTNLGVYSWHFEEDRERDYGRDTDKYFGKDTFILKRIINGELNSRYGFDFKDIDGKVANIRYEWGYGATSKFDDFLIVIARQVLNNKEGFEPYVNFN